MTKQGNVRIVDVSLYPNLKPSLGHVVPCEVEELLAGIYMYHVAAKTFIDLGCDVGRDNKPFPFYASEIEVMYESEPIN